MIEKNISKIMENMARPSYLVARDPSLAPFYKFPIKKLFQNSILEESAQAKEDEKIAVYLRLKKVQDVCRRYKFNDDTIYSQTQNKLEKYHFSYIFNTDKTQNDIFNYIVKPRMLEFIEAKNCTFLTYGCTGSGKTYTLVGTDSEPGIIPRSLFYLFRSLQVVSKAPQWKPTPDGETKELSPGEIFLEREKQRRLVQSSKELQGKHLQHLHLFHKMQERLSLEPLADVSIPEDVATEVWISFIEIYNETVFDLLNQRTPLKMGFVGHNAYVKNASSIHVQSAEEAFELLQFGLLFLNYASTAVNNHSSRSHFMFTVKLVQSAKNGRPPILSCFTFCDLAGSERLKKTHNAGIRLKESNNINTSLFTLQKCIKMIRDSQHSTITAHIPYRESKLTQILQAAMSGLDNSMSMIVNFNPSTDMFDQSQIVLKFSAITRDIVLQSSTESFQSSDSTVRSERVTELKLRLAEKRKILRQKQDEMERCKNKVRDECFEMCSQVLEKQDQELEQELKQFKQEKENKQRLQNQVLAKSRLLAVLKKRLPE